MSSLQDYDYLKRVQLARNVDHVDRAARLAKELDREIATSAEMRALFELKSKAKVPFPNPEVGA